MSSPNTYAINPPFIPLLTRGAQGAYDSATPTERGCTNIKKDDIAFVSCAANFFHNERLIADPYDLEDNRILRDQTTLPAKSPRGFLRRTRWTKRWGIVCMVISIEREDMSSDDGVFVPRLYP